jgi:hypothetical protein
MAAQARFLLAKNEGLCPLNPLECESIWNVL